MTDAAVPPLPADPAPAAGRSSELPTAAPAQPFARAELLHALRRPDRLLDVVLAEHRRLAVNLAAREHLAPTIAVLMVAAILAALPFGALDGLRASARPTLLFLGSVLLCVPALQVFSAYLGLRLRPAQCLAIALVIPAAAALLSFGFAPIQWFLAATMPAEGGAGGPVTRTVLLTASLVLALSHVNRCLLTAPSLRSLSGGALVWLGWQLLLLFVAWRMANTLGLWP